MLSTPQLVAVLALATGLLALSARRLGILGLLIQFLLRTFLLMPLLLSPVLYAQLALGLASTLILYITAASQARVQHSRPRRTIDPLVRMGGLYGLLCVALAGFVALGIYSAFPLPGLPSATSLTCYWLVLSGLLLITIEGSVLGQGLAALTALNGFEVAFLHLDAGLLMVGLLSLLELGLVLVIVVLSDQQLQSNRTELG